MDRLLVAKANNMSTYIRVEVEHLITASIFAKALADHFWSINEEFDDDFTGEMAERILRQRLEHRGAVGCVGVEDYDSYKAVNAAALAWIKVNYHSLY